MRVGAFELNEPPPELKDPYAFVMLSPWIDVGGVGRLALSFLEAHFGALELGKFSRPGLFYDFTRYRPMLYRIEGRRDIRVPNTFINYARRAHGNDLLFFHCLEPHAHGETYVESILKVLDTLKVKVYCQVGGMYDSVPHTRPLIVSGMSTIPEIDAQIRRLNISQGGYQGPTSINSLIPQRAQEHGIETMSLMVHLPSYAQLEEDHSGQYELLNLLCRFYNFSIDLSALKWRGDEQYKKVSTYVEGNPQAKQIVQALELQYDTSPSRQEPTEPMPKLSSEVEEFLKGINESFEPDQ